MVKPLLRDAVIEDLPKIVEIYNSTIPSRVVTADTEPISIESRYVWFSTHSPDFRPIWVAEISGEICGWISFEKFKDRPAYRQTAEISIYLDEQFRGQGIGKYLLETAIASCNKLNIRTLVGLIFGHNDKSLRLFTKYGFEKWAHLPNIAELDGVERDLVIVGKRIW